MPIGVYLRTLFALCCFSISFPSSADVKLSSQGSSAIDESAFGPWKEIRKEKGISVFKRAYKDSKFKQFRGEIITRASLSSFVALLLDADSMASWMYRTVKVREVERLSANERIAYMSFDFAPLPDRDVVVRNRISQDPSTLKVFYSMEVITNHDALADTNLSHIEALDGFVTAEPIGEGQIKIIYQAHIEPGSSLMRFPVFGPTITNALLAKTPFYTLQNAAQRIAEPRYQNVQYDFIKEAIEQAGVIQ